MSTPNPTIHSLGTGLIYRNPKPHVHSIHAYFPSVAVMDNGEILATLVLGEAFESTDSRTHIARSVDGGETWNLEGQLPAGDSGPFSSNYSRITALPGGKMVVFMARHDRALYPEEGLANPETLGFVPTDLLIIRSSDYGRTWDEPQFLGTPLKGPFEICAPITTLKGGQWIIPSSPWHEWDGACHNGYKMLAFVSKDEGKTWPGHWDVMDDPQLNTFYWESKIVELQDGGLLAVAWSHDRGAAQDGPNVYAISRDGGESWSSPASTGLQGQTLTPLVLSDGRILSVYRRMDKPGLWANISRLEGGAWINEAEAPLWGNETAGLTAVGSDVVASMNVLRFGAPCLTTLADGAIFLAFWCYEDCVSNIRWFKLSVD